jgi:hypothetical protein
VVHGLGEDVEFLVLPPAADLQAHVVDGAAQDQAERAEAHLPHQQELVHGQVRGEDGTRPPRLQLSETAQGVLRYSGHA